eukprot:UN04621
MKKAQEQINIFTKRRKQQQQDMADDQQIETTSGSFGFKKMRRRRRLVTDGPFVNTAQGSFTFNGASTADFNVDISADGFSAHATNLFGSFTRRGRGNMTSSVADIASGFDFATAPDAGDYTMPRKMRQKRHLTADYSVGEDSMTTSMMMNGKQSNTDGNETSFSTSSSAGSGGGSSDSITTSGGSSSSSGHIKRTKRQKKKAKKIRHNWSSGWGASGMDGIAAVSGLGFLGAMFSSFSAASSFSSLVSLLLDGGADQSVVETEVAVLAAETEVTGEEEEECAPWGKV